MYYILASTCVGGLAHKSWKVSETVYRKTIISWLFPPRLHQRNATHGRTSETGLLGNVFSDAAEVEKL